MKPRRLPITILALATGALTLGLAGTAAATSARSPGTAASTNPATGRTVVFDCLSHPQVRPRSFVLTCTDGNDVLTGLSWTSWTPSRANATGTEQRNDCTPSYAQGRFHSYAAQVVLWRTEPVAHHPGERYFTRITVHYPGARPPAYNSSGEQVPGPKTWTRTL